MTGFWIALAVLLIGVVGGIAYAVLRGIAMWRRVKRTGRAFSVESERIAESSAQIETHMDRANASNTRLGRGLGDPLRLDGERAAGSLDPAPHRDPAQHGIGDPAHDADQKHGQRDPEAGHRVLR